MALILDFRPRDASTMPVYNQLPARSYIPPISFFAVAV